MSIAGIREGKNGLNAYAEINDQVTAM